MRSYIFTLFLASYFFLCLPIHSQERPYFVAYDHFLEEPGSLEIAWQSSYATQRGSGDFLASVLEFEYGVTGWWTTELYLSGQSTLADSTVFTGYRFENRIRPFAREHRINPVLYVEFENVNGADKAMRAVVGHDIESDHSEPNALLRAEREREFELKLILSSQAKGWNISENIIAVKNISNSPWEFGYALGLSRPLTLAASPRPCVFCRENFTAGLEMYGGLGDRYSFGLPNTAHYLAPSLAWSLPRGMALRVSPGFGLNSNSHRFLLRWSLTREFSGFGPALRRVFGARP
ncbi:MAG: hypothetical protein LAN71_03795 [Acidobacteriia bacterium]|nr:hypothetical protein [Terriglobia bacterium]